MVTNKATFHKGENYKRILMSFRSQFNFTVQLKKSKMGVASVIST